MGAFNVVRFKVKPGREEAFVEAHRRDFSTHPGMQRASLVKTGERTYCFVGEWDTFESIAAARPQMIATLDRFRGDLEDLGNGLGVTDPVYGPVVVEITR